MEPTARVAAFLDPARQPDEVVNPLEFTADERDQISFLTGLACDPEPKARQSDAEATDIRVILRDGLVPMGGRVPVYGHTVDFGVDLIGAYEAAERAREAFDALPHEVRSRYASWQDFAHAIAMGQVEFVPADPVVPDPVPAPVVPES